MGRSALAGVGSCLQKGPALSDIHQFVRIAQIKSLNSNCVLVLMFHFVMYSKIEMGTSQITEIVPVWKYKGEGADKMYLYSRIQGGQLKPQTHNHMCTSKKSKLGR